MDGAARPAASAPAPLRMRRRVVAVICLCDLTMDSSPGWADIGTMLGIHSSCRNRPRRREKKGSSMVAEATEALAEFAANLRYDDLPPKVREHCKALLLDALACALAGDRGEETHQLAALA